MAKGLQSTEQEERRIYDEVRVLSRKYDVVTVIGLTTVHQLL